MKFEQTSFGRKWDTSEALKKLVIVAENETEAKKLAEFWNNEMAQGPLVSGE